MVTPASAGPLPVAEGAPPATGAAGASGPPRVADDAGAPHGAVTGREDRRDRRPSDRLFKVVALVAGVCLVGFVVFVLVRGPAHDSGGGGSAALAAPPPSLLAPGTAAPTFSLPALAGGPPVNLAGLRGRPAVLNFFASWCPDCRAELDAVATEARAARGKVAFAGIDANESSTTEAMRLLAEAGAIYPVGLDPNAKVATAYLVQALPVSYFLDAQGRVVGAALGPQSLSSLRRWVARLEAQA